MSRLTLALTLALLALSGCGAPSSAVVTETQQSTDVPAGVLLKGKVFTFNEVKEGIYLAVGTGPLAVVGNSAVIVGSDSVTVVDDHVSPAAAWVLLEELKEITDKPVRYVINTHFHFDHAHGNQIFEENVSIIGHEFTREMLMGRALEMPLYQGYLNGIPGRIERLKMQVAAESDPARKAELQTQLEVNEANAAAQADIRLTPPNVTLRNELTLHTGGREIQVRHLGRGHTAGDVIVYLPAERVVITGDFLTAALSNMSDGYLMEWADSLEKLKEIDFETVLPGHGDAFTDKAKIDYFQAYLRDVWTEVSRLKAQGLSAEEAATRADLTQHREHFPTIQGPGVPLLAAQRVYELIDGGAN